MTLAFTLVEQNPSEWVDVVADQPNVRIIGRISREAIEDHLAENGHASKTERKALVLQHLPRLAALIEAKYRKGDYVKGSNRQFPIVKLTSADL